MVIAVILVMEVFIYKYLINPAKQSPPTTVSEPIYLVVLNNAKNVIQISMFPETKHPVLLILQILVPMDMMKTVPNI